MVDDINKKKMAFTKRSIYSTFVVRITESFRDSDEKLRAKIGDTLFTKLKDMGYTSGAPLISTRQEHSPLRRDASLESKTTYAIVSMFRRRVLASGMRAKRFAVEPLFIPFSMSQMLMRHDTNARGAWVRPSCNGVQLVFMNKDEKEEGYFSREDYRELVQKESALLRYEENSFDAVLHRLVHTVVASLPNTQWISHAVFVNGDKLDELQGALSTITDSSQVLGVDNNVGQCKRLFGKH
ncbi:hypothetical protein PPROV_000291600 [Pycnococcus provasolii]|uniref:Uncharacterized protein n=1 Tax=Pycnococcus provasolii TaxID=41880 RepID=A0A830HBX4_9CHLO|nr:hypothetical protein PPROV_000291600 [Pycnococcus provasolii]